MNLQLRGIALYWQMHTPCRAAGAKNQYPLKSMIPALSRENILADNFIYGIALENSYAPKRGCREILISLSQSQ